ncbi:MAG: hypothetical protein HYY84_05155 [Deltaproteobacteria bacterium]|nr:hypothetical protein [Deltaproteobacteria bacterium]
MKKVIPEHMNPNVESEIVERGGQKYLQTNEAMFTFYKRTKGEFSKYFLGLRDEKKIYGMHCPKCNSTRVPPFELMCPDCDFAEMKEVEVGDTGVMNTTPPVTYFAHSLFQSWVPFGRGRVVLKGVETALPIHVFTTKGVLTPFVFKKGTPVKVVFRNERIGKPTDIFAVPQSELSPAQIAKSPLMESDLDFSAPDEPKLAAGTAAHKASFAEALKMLTALAAGVEKSPRAQHNLAGWKRSVAVKTAGGNLSMLIDDGKLAASEGLPKGLTPDFVMVCEDPKLLVEWMTFKEALTNAIISGRLWISVNKEFTTIFKLDRLPRSTHRDAK